MTSEEQMIRDEIAQVEKVLSTRKNAFEQLNAKLLLWGSQPHADMQAELDSLVHQASVEFVEKFANPSWFTHVFLNADRWYAKKVSKARQRIAEKHTKYATLNIEVKRSAQLIADLEHRLFDLHGDLRNLS